jgi:23S rRNA pseudouridine1911/1915/1917 synthase
MQGGANSGSTQEIRLTVDIPHRRLDKYLAHVIPHISRSQLQRLIHDGCVLLDGQIARASAPVVPGMDVRVYLKESHTNEGPVPEVIDLDVVFEDEHVLVVNKPAGLVVHPAAGHSSGTLVNAVLAHCPGLQTGEDNRPGIVHRLDRDTSGLLVVAKSEKALTGLRQQFKNRRVAKTYLALVHGHPPVQVGVVDAPIGRDPKNRKRMSVMASGRPSRTGFRELEELGDYSLLEVSLETGRTHQIRVHLAWLGVPVVSDGVYGYRKPVLGLHRQFLHAWKLAFVHPIDSRSMIVEAPLPSDLRDVLRGLGSKARV